MSEKDTILSEKIWYVGIADFKEYYEYAYDWLIGEDYRIIEDKYKEVHRGEGKDMEILWKADKKITDYFKISLELKWKVLGMVDVEVEMDGKKRKMQKMAECKITLKGILEKDYSGKWGVKGSQKFLKELYNKYIIPQRTEEMEGKTREIVQKFKEEMKAYLDLIGKHVVAPP
jgi:hypothetical protein